MRAILAAAVALSPVAVAACTTLSDTTAATDGDLAREDNKGYLLAAVAGDLFEIQSSEVALTKAQRPEVREFARMLLAHHSGMTESLWDAARASGMVRTHEWMLPPPMQRSLEELQQASPADFDRVYVRQQVLAHERALTLHRNYASKGDAAALRQAATAAVPVLQQHLDRARQLL